MAKKISQLPAAAALTGAELVPVVQAGATVRTTVGALSSGGSVGGGMTLVEAVYGATTTVAVSGSTWATLAAAGDTTLAVTGAPGEGTALVVAVTASGGDRAVTLPAGTFVIPTSSSLTSPISVPAGKETVLGFRYRALDGKWRVVSAVPGY